MPDNKSVSHIPVLTGSTNYRAWWIKVDSYADLHSFSAAYEGINEPANQTNPTLVETAGLRELKAKGLLKSTVRIMPSLPSFSSISPYLLQDLLS